MNLPLHPSDRSEEEARLKFPQSLEKIKAKVEQFCTDAAADEPWLVLDTYFAVDQITMQLRWYLLIDWGDGWSRGVEEPPV